MFDELKILITGDTTGIESAVKKALNIVQGGVEKMNDQTVDWTSIFSRAVSPAIISGVASVFAFAISQAIGFQSAMAQTGTAAGESNTQIAQMSQAALQLSTTVPASAQDIASAMTKVSNVFSDTSDQQQIVLQMAELAASGFGSLSDIVNASIPIFQQFGVKTTDQAVDVLTSLMHAAEGAKESIPELASQFGSFSDQLPAAVKNVDSFNTTISTFAAEVGNLGAAGAVQIFSALGKAAQGASPEMRAIGLSMESVTKSLLSDGGLSAIQAATDAIVRLGPNAALVAQGMGLSAQQVSQFQVNASKLGDVATDAQAIATNTQSISAAFAQANVGTNQLLVNWNKIVKAATDLGSGLTPLAIMLSSMFANAAGDADSFFKDVTDGFSSMLSVFYGNKLSDALTGTFKGISNAFDDIVNKPLQQAANGIVGAFTGVSSNGLNSALQNTGVGFSSGILGRIDQTASQNGLVDALTSALQTGIKGGQYAQLVNTFNLSVPAGGGGLTAKQIADQLYKQFQGTQ